MSLILLAILSVVLISESDAYITQRGAGDETGSFTLWGDLEVGEFYV